MLPATAVYAEIYINCRLFDLEVSIDKDHREYYMTVELQGTLGYISYNNPQREIYTLGTFVLGIARL